MQMGAEDAIKATVDELLKVLSANNIMGEPIEMEDKMIIPITKMGMGFGTGSSPGERIQGKDEGATGAGGGAGVFPVAVVIVFKGVSGSEGIKVVPLSAPNPISEPMASIAHIIAEKLAGRQDEKGHRSGNAASIEVE
jgi:uncharacterized spore protein YtfJ